MGRVGVAVSGRPGVNGICIVCIVEAEGKLNRDG